MEQSVDGGWRIAGADDRQHRTLERSSRWGTSVLDSGDTGGWSRQACTALAEGCRAVQFLVKLRLTSKVDALFHVKRLYCAILQHSLTHVRKKWDILRAQEKHDAYSQNDESRTVREWIWLLVNLLCTSATSAAMMNSIATWPVLTVDLTCSAFGIESRTLWPKLSMCGKWILSTPTTSISSERVFSVALAEHWTTVTVDRLLFSHGL